MDNNNDVIELLDILYGMVTEAWGVPLGNDKCIIERDKAIEIINDIKANLPSALAEAKRLVCMWKSQSPDTSAVAKWVKVPAHSIPRWKSMLCLSSSASRHFTPMRVMPVSTARW